MTFERPEDFYGCEEMSHEECLALACEYRQAALHLKTLWKTRQPASRAPFRFTAVHALELYLTAYLLRAGEPWEKVRALGHNLHDRYQRAAERGLTLRKRTVSSLAQMSERREYLRSRYSTKDTDLSQLNKVESALNCVAEKVAAVR